MKKLVHRADYKRRKLELEALLAFRSAPELFFSIVREAQSQSLAIERIAEEFKIKPEQAEYLLKKSLTSLANLVTSRLQKEYESVIDALKRGVPEIGIRNSCLREFLLKNYGESAQTTKGLKKVKHLMISPEGPEAELDLMKRAGFSEKRIADTLSQWVGFHGASTKYLFEDIAQMSELRSIIISDMDFSETPKCIADLSKNKKLEEVSIRDCEGLQSIVLPAPKQDVHITFDDEE